MKVFLIGLPGSGKSTLGPKLAEALNLPFFDLDHEIEKSENLSISDIFSQKGEEYFRSAENVSLKKLYDSHSNYLLATGGGTPCYHDAMSWMNATGVTIYLDTPIDVIVDRLRHKTDRPLLANEKLEDKLQKLFDDRSQIYQQNKITWSMKEQESPIAQLIEEIKKAV